MPLGSTMTDGDYLTQFIFFCFFSIKKNLQLQTSTVRWLRPMAGEHIRIRDQHKLM